MFLNYGSLTNLDIFLKLYFLEILYNIHLCFI